MTNTTKQKLEFNIHNCLDKNLNFLFGSGASAPYIPTFSTPLKKDINSNEYVTFEDLLTNYNDTLTEPHKHLIYYWYYTKIIKQTYVLPFPIPTPLFLPPTYSEYLPWLVYSNYSDFIKKTVNILERKHQAIPRRTNIFTTNYDLFFERTIDEVQKSHRLFLNDGGNGIINKILNISNFHKATMHQGTDDRYSYEIPTINLIKMHGSVAWKKLNDLICIDYSLSPNNFKHLNAQVLYQYFFSKSNTTNLYTLNTVQDFLSLSIPKNHISTLQYFYNCYKNLAIVNPTKEKFSETVFQQHYYQSLRLLSQELERPQTVLICFGFSFADEHIREIIQRSLSNPELHIYIYAYSHDTQFDPVLEYANNVTIIRPDKYFNIPFDEFNKRVFG